MKIRTIFYLFSIVACCPAAENTLGLKFAKISAARVTIGSDSTERGRDSNEAKIEITIAKDYWISTTEVTQEQWLRVMKTNPSDHKGSDLPVEMISCGDAMEFCKLLSEKEGKKYRLPTEAEWEWACRGASMAIRINDVAWTLENSRSVHRVASLKPNPLGLYDMQGNVAEWCADMYTDRSGTTDVLRRVLKGGAFCWPRSATRPAWRTGFSGTEYKASCIGFRIVCETEAD